MLKEVYEKIVAKKEFSDLPKKDVELVWSKFERRETSEEDKIKLTRDLLRKVYFAFGSRKLLNLRNRDEDWVLKKHISTRERFDFYEELYGKLFEGFSCRKVNVFDLGCGVNGFSYKHFPTEIKYVGVEAVGQLVDLTNDYFKKNKIDGKVSHLSLFELEKIKKLVEKESGETIIFLFKTLDSLEMLERDYSKKLLLELMEVSDKIVVSFATRSLVSKKKFWAKRTWLLNFVEENFNLLEVFEMGVEKYIVFEKR
jgi:Ribosomal RNA methyltransferase (FmrO)